MKTYTIEGKTYNELPNPLRLFNGSCYSPVTEALFEELGGVIDDDGQPTTFEVACSQFRQVCKAMGEFLGEPDFKGGFDEYTNFATSQAYKDNPVLGNSLAIQWAGTNEFCKYEGSKIGLGQPEWFYKCWEMVQDD